ncbi:hypothetical protein FQN57_005718 [Myotisia sp. PD_48]|nr:hypothetical protein FQN57_005718 [Myotisia sp. PD_48]
MDQPHTPREVPESAANSALERRQSFISQNSQTASDFINDQLRLEADAREALPYSFDSCTQPLGPLRQSLFSCLTCNPPPDDVTAPYTPAGVCYSCSISCHGNHELVELFTKRNFVCDCGTSRLPSTSPCLLRVNPSTGAKGVHSETPSADNKYNHNFKNHFCGCGDTYDPDLEKGTMFQCLGLGTVETGGCGEDWWHPECLVGVPRADQQEDVDPPLPAGFPEEEDFETFICYKCLDSHPWLKRYAGNSSFLFPIYNGPRPESAPNPSPDSEETFKERMIDDDDQPSKKRKIENNDMEQPGIKRAKPEDVEQDRLSFSEPSNPADVQPREIHESLPDSILSGKFSLFVREGFRDHLCRCKSCYPNLAPHPQLREEEEVYEPPLSENGTENNDGNGSAPSVRTGSLLQRGEAALSNLDRVKAIEGVMVYNHLRDKVKQFLQPFAESGQAVGAEDIKAYFEKLRGDEQGIREAGQASALSSHKKPDTDESGGDNGANVRQQQNGKIKIST